MSVVLVFNHTKRTCHVIALSLSCPALTHFSTLSHKRHDFMKNVTKYKTCILIFCTTAGRNISHFKITRRDAIIHVRSPSYELPYPLCLLDFNQSWSLSIVSKNTQISNFKKIRPLGAKLFHTDGQTDMAKPIIAFINFANAAAKFRSWLLFLCGSNKNVFSEVK